jgi:hypothetical protein
MTYQEFLKKVNMSEGEALIAQNKGFIIDLTKVHPRFDLGIGTFAIKPIVEHEYLGIVGTGQIKYLLGRFVNHSAFPNIRFSYVKGVCSAFAIADIGVGEELVVDYNDNYVRRLNGL